MAESPERSTIGTSLKRGRQYVSDGRARWTVIDAILVAVVKKNGREVGRVRAASPRAMRYIESFGECQVEFVEDRAFCEADAFLGNL